MGTEIPIPGRLRWLCMSLSLLLAAALAVCGGIAAAQEKPAAPPPTQEKAAQEKKDAPEVPVPVPRGKKLVLKDGSFQVVREYQRKGERVRYYSVERSEWEEIPATIVDWDATRKAEAEAAKHEKELVEKIKATEAAERAVELDVDASIQIAPGVFLPSGEGMYAVQGAELVPLEQAAADMKVDKKRVLEQVLSPIPIVPSRHKVQIPGKSAQVRLTTREPEFYIRTDGREPQLELIHAQVKGDTRLLEFISTNIAGQHTEKRQTISLQSWKLAKGVYRFTLSQTLEPGEYAVGEILPEGLNLNVWDFGVDAAGKGGAQAPKNSTPQKQPAAKKSTDLPKKN